MHDARPIPATNEAAVRSIWLPLSPSGSGELRSWDILKTLQRCKIPYEPIGPQTRTRSLDGRRIEMEFILTGDDFERDAMQLAFEYSSRP